MNEMRFITIRSKNVEMKRGKGKRKGKEKEKGKGKGKVRWKKDSLGLRKVGRTDARTDTRVILYSVQCWTDK